MTVLVTGDTRYITGEELSEFFQHRRIVVLGQLKEASKIRGITEIAYKPSMDLGRLIETFDIEAIIYLSHSLNAAGKQLGDLQNLEHFLGSLEEHPQVKFLYVTGPELDLTQKSSRSLALQNALDLCHLKASQFGFDLKVLTSFFLYDPDLSGDSLHELCLELLGHREPSRFYHPEQPIFYVAHHDLLKLVYRIVDSWEDVPESDLKIENSFAISYKALLLHLSNLLGVSLNLETFCREEEDLIELTSEASPLKDWYGWFPQVSVLDDIDVLPNEVYLLGELGQEKEKVSTISLLNRLDLQTNTVKILVLVFLFALSEGLSYWLGGQFYANAIDYRFIMILMAGLLLGSPFGIMAALLAILGYLTQSLLGGDGFATLFFEPMNWLPYMIYLIAGMVASAVKDQKINQIDQLTAEKEDLSQQLETEQDFSKNLLDEKRELAYQILGQEDSYGQAQHLISSLNTPYQDIFVLNLMAAFQERFKTHSIYLFRERVSLTQPLYAMSDEQYSLELTNTGHLLDELDNKSVWINHRMRSDYPNYMMRLENDQESYLLVIDQVDMAHQNLYHQNLFSVMATIAVQSFEQSDFRASHSLTFLDEQKIVWSEASFAEKILTLQRQAQLSGSYQVLMLDVNSSDLQAVSLLSDSLDLFETLGQVGNHLALLVSSASHLSLVEWQKRLAQEGIAVSSQRLIDDLADEIRLESLAGQ
ncbi:hypothetical protein [Streptococcus loxodontisalivarius]|uniref:Nucleoside-diphosphate sugar epimerase n=1 Tax=Streptococcus loxodontisalivarius TaxID=1349415 RepID=A0ABS2PSF4_9STRE|nr:hypothetical protein [Streptococcus loxodontisalivarius]MBM7642969.1 hypothetical protein [Streptococcus loxodontisalivarius]